MSTNQHLIVRTKDGSFQIQETDDFRKWLRKNDLNKPVAEANGFVILQSKTAKRERPFIIDGVAAIVRRGPQGGKRPLEPEDLDAVKGLTVWGLDPQTLGIEGANEPIAVPSFRRRGTKTLFDLIPVPVFRLQHRKMQSQREIWSYHLPERNSVGQAVAISWPSGWALLPPHNPDENPLQRRATMFKAAAAVLADKAAAVGMEDADIAAQWAAVHLFDLRTGDAQPEPGKFEVAVPEAEDAGLSAHQVVEGLTSLQDPLASLNPANRLSFCETVSWEKNTDPTLTFQGMFA